ncbi:hypothetical protein BT67DRAFT_439502 [Trichocladium antarcticum]|uniref:rRNA-processing protein n=1 Tax=Trichocladium antarcticum TaxID=1450529 RepID=A0AAN6ZG78_9PEZI|nr:hypothetical protein BT67DRAFT_439502 [Trichocladium antarcticum]
MSATTGDSVPAAAPAEAAAMPQGMRKNGKQWLPPKKAFRPTAGLTSYEQRNKTRVAQTAMKAKEKEMKEEKETERKRRVQAIKEKQAAKAEKERYELLAAKMHKKRLDRLKRKEKRNKMINS